MSWGYRQSLTLNPNPSTPLKLPLQTASYCQKPQTTNNRFAYYDIEYRKSVTHSPESPCAAFEYPNVQSYILRAIERELNAK